MATIRVNARVLDLEIGQVVEGVELTPLLAGAQEHGYITVLDEPTPEPEKAPATAPAPAPAPAAPAVPAPSPVAATADE